MRRSALRDAGLPVSEVASPAAGTELPGRFGRLIGWRTEATKRFFGVEADRIARLCHGMAERFARGE